MGVGRRAAEARGSRADTFHYHRRRVRYGNIEADVAGPIEAFLFKPKSDNRPSANRLPDVDESGNPLKTVTALRDYSVVATNELRLEVRFSRLGIIYSIDIGITLL